MPTEKASPIAVHARPRQAHREPEVRAVRAGFEDQYETALVDLINSRRSGKPITPKERPAAGNVVDLTEALRRSVGKEAAPAQAPKSSKKPRKIAVGQKEMLMPIEDKKTAKETPAKKAASKPQRKFA